MTIEPVLHCRDVSVSVAFFTQVLDFDLIVAPDPDPTQFNSRHAYVSRAGHGLHLSSHPRENGAFGAEIYVRVSNIDELCARFLANGVRLNMPQDGTAPVDQTWGMREIGFRDPDGNKITYGQPLS